MLLGLRIGSCVEVFAGVAGQSVRWACRVADRKAGPAHQDEIVGLAFRERRLDQFERRLDHTETAPAHRMAPLNEDGLLGKRLPMVFEAAAVAIDMEIGFTMAPERWKHGKEIAWRAVSKDEISDAHPHGSSLTTTARRFSRPETACRRSAGFSGSMKTCAMTT